MDILTIINNMTPCKFIDVENTENTENSITSEITLKNIDSKYYIENFYDSDSNKCKLIKNTKLIKSWEKALNTSFAKSILFEFKIKELTCFTTKYFTFVIEINKNEINKNDIEEIGYLYMNIFRLVPVGSFGSKLIFINTLTSTF
jgi:hypothetical protein